MFGPPQRFTIASTCSWLGHSVSGLRHDTYHPLQIRFRFGSVSLTLNLASHRNSPARSTKSTTSHSYGALSACKLTVSGSVSLPSRGSFHLSLTVLFAIGHWVVFRLGGWSPRLQTGFHVSGPTLDPLCIYSFSSTGILPSALGRSSPLRLTKPYVMSVRNPDSKLSVWPLSLSLAATEEIDLSFSSYGYLDVSVPRVSFLQPMGSAGDT